MESFIHMPSSAGEASHSVLGCAPFNLDEKKPRMGLIGPKVSKNVNVASMVAYTPRGHINIQFSPLLKGVPCIASASRDRFPGLHHVYIIRKT